MTWWYCPKCGVYEFWQPRWRLIAKNVDYMIANGLADPEIKGGRYMGIKRHPKYLHPHCGMCGGPMIWAGSKVRKRSFAEMYIFEGKIVI